MNIQVHVQVHVHGQAALPKSVIIRKNPPYDKERNMKEPPFHLHPEDMADLKRAKTLLEKESIAVKMANVFGDAAEKLARLLPSHHQQSAAMYNVMAIEKSWEFTMTTMSAPDVPPEPEDRHRLYVIISGAVGGVGVMTLFAELPVTTILMLRSVADIAKDEGEDFHRFETKIASLEVFAFGSDAFDPETGETGYYAIRSSLDKPLEESSKYIAKKGISGIGAPFAFQLLAKIAAKYQTMVAARVAATAVPIVGAVVGAMVNVVFLDLFQDKARGHFIVRRLEREYGTEPVRETYNLIRNPELEADVPAAETDRILRLHVWASMGLGLIPLPLADFAGVTVVQLNLLRRLAKAYHLPFFKAKTLLASLTGGSLSAWMSAPLAAGMTKFVPAMGQTVGVMTTPVIAGATTYAIGRVFIMHFASGGTFLTFDPEKVKTYYEQMFEEGKTVATKRLTGSGQRTSAGRKRSWRRR